MWKHPKQNKMFKGSYEFKKNGERIFNLTNGKKEITFESWQAAKKMGWKKVVH